MSKKCKYYDIHVSLLSTDAIDIYPNNSHLRTINITHQLNDEILNRLIISPAQKNDFERIGIHIDDEFINKASKAIAKIDEKLKAQKDKEQIDKALEICKSKHRIGEFEYIGYDVNINNKTATIYLCSTHLNEFDVEIQKKLSFNIVCDIKHTSAEEIDLIPQHSQYGLDYYGVIKMGKHSLRIEHKLVAEKINVIFESAKKEIIRKEADIINQVKSEYENINKQWKLNAKGNWVLFFKNQYYTVFNKNGKYVPVINGDFGKAFDTADKPKHIIIEYLLANNFDKRQELIMGKN